MSYKVPNNRALAAARAAKMMKLFSKGTWTEIMESVDTAPAPPDRAKFDAACKAPAINLDSTERDWLWNYLIHVDKALCNAIPEAAASGW